MCWVSYMATPIVLKKPLRVYKVGPLATSNNFISLYQNCTYYKSKNMPTVEINPEFGRYNSNVGYLGPLWEYDRFYIHEGYHSYLTKETAKYVRDMWNTPGEIGIFEVPVGATIYVNYKLREVVSTDITEYGGMVDTYALEAYAVMRVGSTPITPTY